MADQTTQRSLYEFLVARMETLEPFTRSQIKEITRWSDATLATYLSKQFDGLFEELPDGQFRLKDRFRAYADWKKFQAHVTQVKAPPVVYEPTVFHQVIVFEFYLPLAHESSLRNTLDRLFFADAIRPRLVRIGATDLAAVFGRHPSESAAELTDRVFQFFNDKFHGYSIYHVSGRFRAADLMSSEDAWKKRTSTPYLVDETTAVTRFVFPCSTEEVPKIRFLFQAMFVETITQQISGEDEVWMVESGLENRVHVWKPRGR